jgi:hypothetical protein
MPESVVYSWDDCGDDYINYCRPFAIPTRLSHLEAIFCLRAREFLLLSTSALRNRRKQAR